MNCWLAEATSPATSQSQSMPLCFSLSLPLRLLKTERSATCSSMRYCRRAMKCVFDDGLVRELRTHLEQQQQQQQLQQQRQQQNESREKDAELATPADIMSYAALATAGRTDLVERVIEAGGYPAMLQALGVEPNPEPPLPTNEQIKSRRFASAEIEGRLALGVGRELRLEQPINLNGGASAKQEIARRERASDDVPTASELRSVNATELSDAEKKKKKSHNGEVFVLNGHERMGTLALVTLAAAGHGRASMEMFNENAVTVLGGAANALLLMHGILAIYASVIEARRFGRAPILWFFRVLLAGPAGFIELERLGELKRET